jgi:hypothetical protein
VHAFADEPIPVAGSATNVSYISGGVGESEAEMMRGIAKDYALEIVFVEKSKQREVFLADVKVQIEDANENVMLNAVTEGPYLFANLPQGKYLVIAEYNGVEKRHWVSIQGIKHQRVVFWWPVFEEDKMDATAE